MGIEYRLTLAGDIPLENLAPLVAPHGVEESALPGYPRLLTADLREELGYTVTVSAGSSGYFDAEDDDGTQWEWEPDTYTNIIFDLRKTTHPKMWSQQWCRPWAGSSPAGRKTPRSCSTATGSC